MPMKNARRAAVAGHKTTQRRRRPPVRRRTALAQTVTVQHTLARFALHAAKHTHRYRTPAFVGLSVYLDFKGMGPTVM